MFRIFGWLAGADLLLIVGSILFAADNALVSGQVAFFSSALVLGASSFSYSQMVYRRLADGAAVPDDARDELEKLEDPHDLYSENIYIDNGEAPETKSLKDAIKEEKMLMKKHQRSFYQILKDSRASLSFMRLGAYIALFIGFIYLTQNILLHIPAYLIGLSLPIVIVVWFLVTKKEETL